MLIINNAKIYTMADKVFNNGYVLIKEGKIYKTGGQIDFDYDKKNTAVIDASGCVVTPGLIDAHCHVGITEEKMGFEGDDCNETYFPITPQLKALYAVNPMDFAFHSAVKAGITGVMVGPGSSNIVGGQFMFIKTHGRVINKRIVLEPAAMKIAFGENPKKNYYGKKMLPTTRMTIAAMLDEELYEAKLYIDKKEEHKKKDIYFKREYKKECWIPVFKRQIPLKAHVHRADDIISAINIANKYGLNLTLDHCSEGHLVSKEIKESGFPAIIGPSLAFKNKIEIQNMNFKIAGILHKEGVTVSVMTDHPVSLIQYLAACAAYAVKEGLDMEEGLKSITINAARICNVDSRVGSIEEGKDADIAIFDGDPMNIFTKTLYTIINGKIVYDGIRNIYSQE